MARKKKQFKKCVKEFRGRRQASSVASPSISIEVFSTTSSAENSPDQGDLSPQSSSSSSSSRRKRNGILPQNQCIESPEQNTHSGREQQNVSKLLAPRDALLSATPSNFLNLYPYDLLGTRLIHEDPAVDIVRQAIALQPSLKEYQTMPINEVSETKHPSGPLDAGTSNFIKPKKTRLAIQISQQVPQ